MKRKSRKTDLYKEKKKQINILKPLLKICFYPNLFILEPHATREVKSNQGMNLPKKNNLKKKRYYHYILIDM